nr:hypothetical protein [Tanacetum cinerariifolium]
MGGARGRAYAIDGGIRYSVVSSRMNQLHYSQCTQVETKRTVYGDVVFINTKRILTVAGGCGAWRVVVMERVMVSAVDSGEDVGGAGGWLVAGFVDLPEKCAAPEELAGRWEAPDVFTV